MALPPPTSDGTGPAPARLPQTGVTAESVFDLPFDHADLPAPPQSVPTAQRTRPVVPPTFSAPDQTAEGFALGPSPAAARQATVPMPAPLTARPFSGPALPTDGSDDLGYDDGSFAPLPPMVAKGEWEPEEEPMAQVSAGQSSSNGSSRDHTSAPDPAPAGIGPQWTGPAVPPPPPTPPPGSPPALSFAPNDPMMVASGAPSSGPPASPPLFTPIEPFAAPPFSASRMPVALASKTRLSEGLVVAAAAAAVAGFVWWVVVALTQRQFVYLAVLLGFLVGQCALIGGRRGSILLGALSGALTLVALTVTQYFISRSLAIAEFDADLPLWQGTSFAVDVIRETFTDDPLTGLFVVLAAVIAAVQAGTPGKRASGSLGLPPAPQRSSVI